MLIVYAAPQENPDIAERCDFSLQPNEIEMGRTIPQQAKAQGAKVLVHYSFPRHMSIVMLAARRDLMETDM